MDMRLFTDDVVLDVVEFPAANPSDGTVPASYKDVSEFGYFGFLQIVGVSNDTTVTMQVVQATSAGGAGKKNVTGAITTATSLGSASNNKWAMVIVQQDKLDSANGFRYVAVDRVASGGSATASTIIFLGWRPMTMPVTQPASFAEVIALVG